MERRKVLRVVKIAFWPLLSLGLLLVFVVVPICKAGLWKYASDQMEINPFIAKVMNKYTYHQAKQLSEEWYNRIETIRGGKSLRLNGLRILLRPRGLTLCGVLTNKPMMFVHC